MTLRACETELNRVSREDSTLRLDPGLYGDWPNFVSCLSSELEGFKALKVHYTSHSCQVISSLSLLLADGQALTCSLLHRFTRVARANWRDQSQLCRSQLNRSGRPTTLLSRQSARAEFFAPLFHGTAKMGQWGDCSSSNRLYTIMSTVCFSVSFLDCTVTTATELSRLYGYYCNRAFWTVRLLQVFVATQITLSLVKRSRR